VSYDGWIMLRIAEDDAHELEEIGNYTSNVSPMWTLALTEVMGERTRLSDTEGWSCERAAPILAKALAVMERDIDALRALEPSNGWGDYEGAAKYLGRVSALCERFSSVPGTYLHWWV
jgi:hypothetical protein